MAEQSLGFIITLIIAIFGLTFVISQIIVPLFSTTNPNLEGMVTQFESAVNDNLVTVLEGCKLPLTMYKDETLLVYDKDTSKIEIGDGFVTKTGGDNVICACDSYLSARACQDSLVCKSIERRPEAFKNPIYSINSKHFTPNEAKERDVLGIFAKTLGFFQPRDTLPTYNVIFYLRMQGGQLEIYPAQLLTKQKMDQLQDLPMCL